MRFEIGQSEADINVLLTRLRGTHPPVRSNVITSMAVGLAVIAAIPSLVQMTVAATTPQDRWFGVGMVVFMLLFAAGIVLQSTAKYEVTEQEVIKRSPLALLSWSVHRSEILSIDLHFGNSWALLITTRESAQRALPLEGSLAQALAPLYPEVAPYQATAADRRRWKWLAAGLTALIIAVAVLLWWLGRQGLVAW